MGSPNDLPFDAVYFEDEDLVRSSARSRPRPETNELAVHVAELATQIAELTEAIHVLARPMPERVLSERFVATRPRAIEPMIAEPPARPRFDDEADWPSEAEVTQFSRRQVDRDDGVW